MSVQENGNPSCSCTSCFYKSESEHPSVRKIVQHGTRIDKLFLDEFIPLRERKLLDRLVRTRAVYDDVRTQLLSNSSSEMNEKANLKRRKHSPRRLDRNKSSALLEIVDMVDKGEVMDSKSSECCSCCICASKALLPQYEAGTVPGKRRRHRHRRTGSHMLSKSSDTGGYRSRDRRNVQFKAKHIQSDPCTCTLGIGNKTKRSKGRHKRTQRERSVPQTSYSRERIRKSLQKLKRSQALINRSKTKLRKSIESSALKSYDKLKNARNKVKERFDSSFRKSMQMGKKEVGLPDQTKEETDFKIKKDSITKFKEKLKRNRELKDYECSHLCDEEVCIPEACYEKIKRRKARQKRKSSFYSKHESSMGDTSELLDMTVSRRKCVPVDCVPGKCDPEECREKIIQRKELRDKSSYNKNISSSDASVQAKRSPEKSITIGSKKLKLETTSKEVISEADFKVTSEANIQAGGIGKNVKAGTKKRSRVSKGYKNTILVGPEVPEYKAIQKRKRQAIKTHEIKSMTKHPPGSSRRPVRAASTSSINKVNRKTAKHVRRASSASSFSSVAKTRGGQMKRGNDKILDNSMNRSSKQALRVGSSFSFNIEFYKEKPSRVLQKSEPPINHKELKTPTKNKGHEARKIRPSHKHSNTQQSKKARNTQAQLALKRCFCSLRLKAKKKQPTAGPMRFNPKLPPTVMPYECEPNVCVPSQCDPIVCEKRIASRNKKYSSSKTNTYHKTKSSSSITSRSISSGTSRRLQVNSPVEMKKTEVSAPLNASEPLTERQAVHIGSSFSFKIEFYKENPADGNIVPDSPNKVTQPKPKNTKPKKKRNRSIDGAKRRVGHKRSQISSSTGKSKYTLTKHSLRRCFCTLKLSKNYKTKNMVTSQSKSTGTPNRSLTQMPKMHSELTSRGMATDKQKYRKAPTHKLLPYECEPGICEPDRCDPYECLEIIKKRNLKRRTVQSGTRDRRTRSTSSVTSRSGTPKAKKIQSTLLAYKSEMPTQYAKRKIPREVRTSPSSPDRQAVRIGSSFSFDIEFFKEKTSPSYPSPFEPQKTREPARPKAEMKKPKVKNRGLQGNVKTPQKSTLMGTDKAERSIMIGPAMKRCFCTLKLHKTGKNNRIVDSVNMGTETPVFKENRHLKVQNISTGTRTKGKYKYSRQLEPYECEPYVCVPGECDPYECLERIKRRNLTSKDFGVGTNRSKMRTTSSGTTKVRVRSRNNLAKSKERKRRAAKTQKSLKSYSSSDRSKNISHTYPSKSSKQAVRIGSSFSFDVEFFKDRTSPTQADQVYSRPSVESVESKTSKKVRNRGARSQNRTVSQHSSQAEQVKAKHKGTGVAPMLKRCFCTLKLQKGKQNKKHQNLALSSQKNPKVYAVTQITKLAESKFARRTPWISNNNNNGFKFSMPYRSYNPCAMPSKPVTSIVSVTSGLFQYKDMQSYFRAKQQNNFEPMSSSRTMLQKSVELKSQVTKRIDFIKETEDYFVLKKRETVKTTYTESQLSTKTNWKSTTDSTSTLKYWDSNTNKSNASQLSSFLKRCYCTMNMIIAAKGKKRTRHRLEPYECEPGVCVPDECDPYECEKRIMRRLRKGVSKMSGTNIRSISTSSYTPSTAVGSKGTKARSNRSRPANAQAPKGIKYKTYPKPMSQTNKRQAVRVGSKFSFDIEFSKDRSQAAGVEKVMKEPKHSGTRHRHKKMNAKDAKLKTKGTKGAGVRRYDSVSQSNIAKMEHRGSEARPLLQRCFCTLKLQKKGKRPKERKSLMDQGTATPPRKRQYAKPVPRTVDSAQNTKAVETRKLEPYECEPNVCIPGECNPLDCLELIKKRQKHTRSSGTDSMRSSTSTSSSARQRKHLKGKQIQSEFKAKHVKTKKGSHNARPKTVRQKSPSSQSNRRQAVRVGSSFSFNVEFYKDRSRAQEGSIRYSTPSKPTRVRESRDVVKRTSKHVGSRTAVTERSSQDSKFLQNSQSQFAGLVKDVKSTMTSSFIKRCFCTAKLHGVNTGTKMKQHAYKSQTLLKRCFCTLKSLTAVKQKPRAPPSNTTHVGIEAKLPPAKVEREMNTRRAHNVRPRALEPFECEPGICVPGECDPYVCDKLIKKRNAKVQGRSSNTDGTRTKSTSSSFISTTNRHTQARTKAAKPPKQKRESSVEYVVKDTHKLPPPSPVSTSRQAVRIGSTFSFDVEFYKEKSPHYQEVQAAAKALKKGRGTSQVTRTHGTGTGSRSASRGVMNEARGSQSFGSQATVGREHRGTGVGPMLKRCFCTLKLHKQKNKEKYHKVKTNAEAMTSTGASTPVIKGTPDMHARGVATDKVKPIKYKLEPYECEPGVCVPGECDPYECDKLIQKRNRRDSSTTTQRNRTRSTSSRMRGGGKNKHRQVQYGKHEKQRKELPHQKITVIQAPVNQAQKSKQAVRLGSNFSFNVEFFKDRSYAGGDITPRVQRVTSPPVEKVRRVRSTSQAAGGRAKVRNKKQQGAQGVRHTDSQVWANKVRSTMTGMPPFLKRCFCTLKLHKAANKGETRRPVKPTASIGTQDKIKVHGSPKTRGTDRATHTKTGRDVKYKHLEPYECEPGVCIPNECDPYECEKRIKKRLMQSKMAGTGRPRGHSVSSSFSGSSGGKAKHTQARHREHQAKERRAHSAQKIVVQPTRVSSASSRRQAVKIGSNFSFNVEFYKDRSMGSPQVRQSVVIPSASEKRRKAKHATTKPKKRRDSGASHRGARLHHRHSQSEGTRTESRGSSIAPLLKRCFCTLKLHKTAKHEKNRIQKPQPRPGVGTSTKDIPHIQATSKDASTGVRKKIRQLEPYECEPGVCVPGECDPYECDKLVRRRMKHLAAGTESSRMRSASTMTSRDPRLRTVKTQLHTRSKEHKKRVRQTKPARNSDQSSKRTVNKTSRQAVRLGSNFSFNVEFFKNRSAQQYNVLPVYKQIISRSMPGYAKGVEHKSKPKTKSQGSRGRDVLLQHQKLQASALMTDQKSGMGPLLKRCFCTLTLQNKSRPTMYKKKIRYNPQLLKEHSAEKNSFCKKQKADVKEKNVSTQRRQTSIREKHSHKLAPYECEPASCIPGQCDPYECEERIKKRGIRRKSRTAGTHARKMTVSSMVSQLKPMSRSRRMQASFIEKSEAKNSMVVEQPRFPLSNLNPQSVKFGSNISLNIEFYMETTTTDLPENKLNSEENKLVVLKENVKTGTNKIKHSGVGKCTKLHDCKVQAGNVRTENKSSAIDNAFKRCFCTSKLHKAGVPKPNRVVTVHRAELIPYFKDFQKYQCPKYDEIQKNATNIKQKDKNMEMKTLLPYKPEYYNKNDSISTESQKCCHQKTKFSFINVPKLPIPNESVAKCFENRKCPFYEKSKVQIDAKSPQYPKRLTAKPTKTSIHASSSNGNKLVWNSLKDVVRCCKFFFSKDEPMKSVSENKCQAKSTIQEIRDLKTKKLCKRHTDTKSELYAKDNNQISEPKKSKSLKIGKNTYEHNSLGGCLNIHSKFSRFQAGDTYIPAQEKTLTSEVKNQGIKVEDKTEVCTDRIQIDISTSNNTKKETNLMKKYPDISPSHNIKRKPVVVYQVHTNKIKPQCLPDCIIFKNGDKEGMVSARDNLNVIVDLQRKDHTTCPRCGGSKRYKKDKITPCDGTNTKQNYKKDEMEETKAEFISPYISEVVYKSNDASDIKRKSDPQASKMFTPLVKKGKCRCCICKKPLPPEAPCVCGSPVCAEERQKIEDKKKAEAEKKAAELKKKIKPCPCGMGPCAKELKKTGKVDEQTKKAKAKVSASSKALARLEAKEKEKAKNKEKMQKMKTANKEKRKKIKAKEKKKLRKKMYLAYLARQKQYKKQDKIRRRKRKKEDRFNNKQIRKYRDTPDLLLLAESLIDMFKFVFVVFTDILRCLFRSLIDPKRVADAFKTIRRDPKRIFVMIKRAIFDSGAASTLRRIKRRICAMKIIRTIKYKMEQYAVTNYLLHIAAKDPRKRIRRRRPGEGKRRKDPVDFECSPYMAQLRRHPYLVIYYNCPWFYPHCLSISNALKQFLDVILFLLALIVWCPCIICMEFVRAITCWLFCTGG